MSCVPLNRTIDHGHGPLCAGGAVNRATLVENISHDDDVTFHWVIASANVEEDVVNSLFDRILKLYVTIRGFSFASSILEMYKNEGKKSTQKKKTLRQTLQ